MKLASMCCMPYLPEDLAEVVCGEAGVEVAHHGAELRE